MKLHEYDFSPMERELEDVINQKLFLRPITIVELLAVEVSDTILVAKAPSKDYDHLYVNVMKVCIS